MCSCPAGLFVYCTVGAGLGGRSGRTTLLVAALQAVPERGPAAFREGRVREFTRRQIRPFLFGEGTEGTYCKLYKSYFKYSLRLNAYLTRPPRVRIVLPARLFHEWSTMCSKGFVPINWFASRLITSVRWLQRPEWMPYRSVGTPVSMTGSGGLPISATSTMLPSRRP